MLINILFLLDMTVIYVFQLYFNPRIHFPYVN